MENLLLVIVILLAIILILLLVVVCYLLFKYLKLNDSQQNCVSQSEVSYEDKIPESIKKQIDAAKSKRIKESIEGQSCVDHPENPAKGKCSISGEAYCELCITKEKDVRIARKFLHLFLDNEWENIYFVEDMLVGEDKIKQLMQIKMDIWNNEGTPIITQKQFKINIETDEIETFTVVMTRPEDSESVKSKFSFLTH